MPDLQTLALKESLRALLSDIDVTETRVPKEKFVRPKDPNNKGLRQLAGYYANGEEIVLYFARPSEYHVFTISRKHRKISKKEHSLFRSFGKIISPMLAVGDQPFARQIESILSLLSFENIFVAANMRGGAAVITSLALPALTLTAMQRLLTNKYEGQSCTSGFVFVKKVSIFIKQLKSAPFNVEVFDDPIAFELDYFNAPVTYRYVDGRNSFYILGRDTKIHGIARVSEPKAYGLLERAKGEHIRPFFSHDLVPWVASISASGDLDVALKNGTHFRYTRSHWRYLDDEEITNFLDGIGVAYSVTIVLTKLICAISELRVGTLILFPDDPANVPNFDRSIDTSAIAKALRHSIIGRNITDLSRQGRAIGMLTSDGLTTLYKDGTVAAAGTIIDLGFNTGSLVSGGGRTQAAVSASAFGTAIKVSEDGPITIFRNGNQVLRLDR